MNSNEIEQLREDVLRTVDSVFAEHGSYTTQTDVEEAIKGVFDGYEVDHEQ